MLALSASDGAQVRSDGLADLTLAVREGRTRLVRSVTRPPLQVQRALYLDDAVPDMAFVYLANPTAGVFQGDTLQVAVQVSPGAKAHITTQAATKVYAMPNGSAHQEVRLYVAEGAVLEYLPDPVIPFRGARFSQDTAVMVAPGGTVIYGEVLTAGRTAMGEHLAYAGYRNRLTFCSPEGSPRYREAFSIEPGRRAPLGPGLMGRAGACVLGTLLVLSDAVDATALRDRLRAILGTEYGVQAGVSLFPAGGGIVVKALGSDIAPVRKALGRAWALARQEVLGAGLPPRRKY